MPAMTKRQAEIIQLIYERNKILANGTDDQRRLLTRTIAEQWCYEFGSNHGTKSQFRDYPQSKDALAVQDNDRLYGWDWQNGTTRAPQVKEGSPSIDMTGQYFIRVTAINHLGTIPNPPLPDKLDQILANQNLIVNTLNDLMVSQLEIERKLLKIIENPMMFPQYEGSIFGVRFTLKPKENNET
jgi:hypothetical protein